MPKVEIVRKDDKFYMDGAFYARRHFCDRSHEHTHDFVEIVYVIKGKCTHTVNGKQYPLSKGDMLLMNYHCTHSFESAAGFEYADVLIKPEFVSESLGGSETAFSLLTVKDFEEFADTVSAENCKVSFSGEERQLVERIIAMMCDELPTANQGADLLARSGLNILLTMLFRKMSLPMHRDEGISDGLLGYIKENCAGRITLEELAGRCFYHPAYFSRIFKSYTGMPLTEYLTECRMERARDLLVKTELPVENIIGECGYSNRTKFFGDFSRLVGCTPLQYRKSKK